MRQYLAILMIQLMVLVNCASTTSNLQAAVNDPVSILESSSQPSTGYGNFLVIDFKNPPKNGIWMSWEDAKIYSNRLQKERLDWKRYAYRQQRELELEKARRQMLEQNATAIQTGYEKFWIEWGFPLGIGLGLVTGVAALIAINNVKR